MCIKEPRRVLGGAGLNVKTNLKSIVVCRVNVSALSLFCKLPLGLSYSNPLQSPERLVKLPD